LARASAIIMRPGLPAVRYFSTARALLVSLPNDVLDYPTTFLQQLAYVVLLTPLCAPSAHHRRDICTLRLDRLLCQTLGLWMAPCCNWLTLGPIAWGKHTATGSLSDRKCNIATTVLPTMACALRHRRHLSDRGPVIFFSRLENCFPSPSRRRLRS